FSFFFFTPPPPTEIYTLSLHDALPIYAQMALDGLDTDGDGIYSQDELAPLTKENIESLKDYNYFTYPRVNGKLVPIGAVTEYGQDRKSTRLNSSHDQISYAVFCLKKKK